MAKIITILIVLINLSSATLYNVAMVADEEVMNVGSLNIGNKTMVEVPRIDSLRVIFTLGQEREGWLGTDKLPIADTIYIDDNTETFEVAIPL